MKFNLELIREKEFNLFFWALGKGKILKYNATPRIEVAKKYSGEIFKKHSNESNLSKVRLVNVSKSILKKGVKLNTLFKIFIKYLTNLLIK